MLEEGDINMKNIKTFFVAIAAGSLLAGCGAKASWTQVSYTRVLEAAEKAVLIAKVKAATLEKLSKYEITSSEDDKTALADIHNEGKVTVEFFSNGEAFREETTKGKSKTSGETFTTELKETLALAQYETGKYAYFSEDSEDNFDYELMEIPEGYESFAIKDQLADVFARMASDEYSAVENKKSMPFFVYSYEEEVYMPEAAGHEKRIQHSINRRQGLIYLNKDYTIKSCTYFESYQTNVDPDTNELSKKVKTVYEDKESQTFKYGSRGDGSKKLSSYRDIAKNSYFLVNGSTFAGKLLKADATELGNIGFNLVARKQLSYSKQHLVYRANNVPAAVGGDPEVAVDSLKLTFTGSSKSNSVTDPVAIDVELLVGSLQAGTSGMTLENQKLKMGKANATLTIEFDVEATSGGANFTNVAAYAEPYMNI